MGSQKLLFRKCPGFQELHQQPIHPAIRAVLTHAVHQPVVVDMIEAAVNVPLDLPLILGVVTFSVYCACLAWPRGHAKMLECAAAAPTRTESVRDMPEACFEYGLQKLLDRRLHDAIRDRGNAQGSELPWFARLGD